MDDHVPAAGEHAPGAVDAGRHVLVDPVVHHGEADAHRDARTLVVPEMLAAAAVAMAWMLDPSLAVTLTAPPAERLAAPSAAVSTTVASMVFSMVLKLRAPVALAAMAEPLPLTATPTAMPKASESISALLSAATVMSLPITLPDTAVPWGVLTDSLRSRKVSVGSSTVIVSVDVSVVSDSSFKV